MILKMLVERVSVRSIQMRRLARLTSSFSKKYENLWSALCLHFAWYNLCRVHRTLRVTPAMEAKLTDRVWSLADLLVGRGWNDILRRRAISHLIGTGREGTLISADGVVLVCFLICDGGGSTHIGGF